MLERLAGTTFPPEVIVRNRVISKKKHAAQFGMERLYPTNEEGAELSAVHQAYREWCETKGVDPLPPAEIGLLLAELFETAGLSITEQNGRLVTTGVALEAQAAPNLPLARPTPRARQLAKP